jgi:transposase-like protein
MAEEQATAAPEQAMSAPCPKCRSEMIFVTSLPHPRSPQMQRTTFVCYNCNQTRSYSLSTAMAKAYELAVPRPTEDLHP